MNALKNKKDVEWRNAEEVRPATIAKMERALQFLGMHGFIEPACRQANVSKVTFYAFKKQHQDFEHEVADAIAAVTVELEATSYACARKALTDPRYNNVLIFACKAKLGWSDRQIIRHEGGDKPIQHETRIDLSGITDEQLDTIIRAAKAGRDDARGSSGDIDEGKDASDTGRQGTPELT